MPNENLSAEQVAEIAAAAAAKAISSETVQLKADLVEMKARLDRAYAAARPPAFGDDDDNGVAGGGHGGTKTIMRFVPSNKSESGVPYGRREVQFVSLGTEMREFAKQLLVAKKRRTIITGRSADWDGEQKTATVGDNDNAGFTVPPEYVDSIMMKIYEDSYFMNNAMKIPMASDEISGPQLRQIFGTTPSYYGGVTWSWGDAEGVAATESVNPKFDLRSLRAKKLRGLHKSSRELVADSPQYMSFLSNILGTAAAFEIDEKIWRGSGAGEPLGFLIASGTQVVARTTAADFKYHNDVPNMDARIDEAGGTSLVWFMRKATRARLPLAVDTVGQPKVSTTWVDVSAPISGRPLAGYEVVQTKHAAVLADKGAVVLADPKAYLIGLKQGIEIEVNTDEFWSSDIVATMVRVRMDGQPVYPDFFAILDA